METRFSLDPSEKVIVIENVQDVEPILDRNKHLRTVEQKSDWGRHVASIPNVIMTKWLNEEYAKGNVNLKMFSKEFDELVAVKLRDPDWAYLRTDCKSSAVGFTPSYWKFA